MYKIIPEKNNLMRVHGQNNGQLLFSFINKSELSPSKQLISYAYSPKEVDDYPKLNKKAPFKQKPLSEFVNGVVDRIHFYGCRKCDESFGCYSELKQHQFCCTESIEADECPEVAEFPWTPCDPTYQYSYSNGSNTAIFPYPKGKNPIENAKIVSNDKNLFLQSVGLVKKCTKYEPKRPSKDFKHLSTRISHSYCSRKPLCVINMKDHSLDFSSPLGVFMARYPAMPDCVSYQECSYSSSAYCKIRKPLWYENFCTSILMNKQALPYLRDRNSINAPRPPFNKKISQTTHLYSFTKHQRVSRYRFLCTGLTKRERRLKRLCRKCSIVVPKLSVKTLKEWGAYRPKSKRNKPKEKPPSMLTENLSSPSLDNNEEHHNLSPNQAYHFTKRSSALHVEHASVRLEDLSTLLVTRSDRKIFVRGSNISVRNSAHLQNMLIKSKRKYVTPKTVKRLSPKKANVPVSAPKLRYLLNKAKPQRMHHSDFSVPSSTLFCENTEPDVIEISSDDDDDDIVELCFVKSPISNPHQNFTSNGLGSHALSDLGKSSEYIDIENCHSDDEITISQRLQESLQIYSHCSVKLSDITCTLNNLNHLSKNSVNPRHQPKTHLFKCHACKDVEQLYYNQASMHIQNHMSTIHGLGLSGMFDHLIEHQQDFGTYFVVVVEAFPSLSLSPAKSRKVYSGIDFNKKNAC